MYELTTSMALDIDYDASLDRDLVLVPQFTKGQQIKRARVKIAREATVSSDVKTDKYIQIYNRPFKKPKSIGNDFTRPVVVQKSL